MIAQANRVHLVESTSKNNNFLFPRVLSHRKSVSSFGTFFTLQQINTNFTIHS